jgi:hypothetical protein
MSGVSRIYKSQLSDLALTPTLPELGPIFSLPG